MSTAVTAPSVTPVADVDGIVDGARRAFARRIAWGKFMNAGQTCIAPDYVLVEREVHDRLVEQLRARIGECYGHDPQRSADYARIVNDTHFHRLERSTRLDPSLLYPPHSRKKFALVRKGLTLPDLRDLWARMGTTVRAAWRRRAH